MGSTPGRLTRLDEWPRHQPGRTFDSVASDSPHWNDGYYFTLGDARSGTTLFSGLRLYPNTDVMDAYVCLVVDGVQVNVRASRRLRPHNDDLAVGPFSVEIVEPLRVLRTTCGDNDQGVSYDLTWTAHHEPYMEEEVVRWSGGRLVYQRSNYDQCMAVEGRITWGDRVIEVSGPSWVGVRDHSWGLGRTGGPTAPSVAPDTGADPRRGFAVRQWTMLKMRDRVLFWQLHQGRDGSFSQFEARVLPLDGSPTWDYLDAEFDYTRVDGHARLESSTVSFLRPDGGHDRYRITPVGHPAYLQGGGYHEGFDDGLGRGVYRGEDHREGEAWDVSHPVDVVDPRGVFRPRADAWAEQFATCVNLDDPDDTGFGHLECVIPPA
jgi:hypothetical protein